MQSTRGRCALAAPWKIRQDVLCLFLGEKRLVVTTDAASRDVFLSGVSLTVNFSLPRNHDAFMHRGSFVDQPSEVTIVTLA